MWFYHRDAEEIETLTCLATGAQVVRSDMEIWWRGNVIDRPLEQDEMLLSKCDAKRRFGCIINALLAKGDLAGYSGQDGVTYPIPGE